MLTYLVDNTAELLWGRHFETWQGDSHRIIVRRNKGRYTAQVKSSVLRLEGPMSESMRGALRKLPKHTAKRLNNYP